MPEGGGAFPVAVGAVGVSMQGVCWPSRRSDVFCECRPTLLTDKSSSIFHIGTPFLSPLLVMVHNTIFFGFFAFFDCLLPASTLSNLISMR